MFQFTKHWSWRVGGVIGLGYMGQGGLVGKRHRQVFTSRPGTPLGQPLIWWVALAPHTVLGEGVQRREGSRETIPRQVFGLDDGQQRHQRPAQPRQCVDLPVCRRGWGVAVGVAEYQCPPFVNLPPAHHDGNLGEP